MPTSPPTQAARSAQLPPPDPTSVDGGRRSWWGGRAGDRASRFPAAVGGWVRLAAVWCASMLSTAARIAAPSPVRRQVNGSRPGNAPGGGGWQRA
jgi:hypothetical protein